MAKKAERNKWRMAALLLAAVFLLSGCYRYGPTNRIYTPVPTLIPVEDINPLEKAKGASAVLRCPIRPVDLLGAWVEAGYSETEPFEFTGEDGQLCAASYEKDIARLFSESNLWFDGAPACVSCHNTNLETSFQRMDLSSYAGILAGAQRPSSDEMGMDILGGGNWSEARLYYMLINRLMPLGRPVDSPEKGPLIYAGSPITE